MAIIISAMLVWTLKLLLGAAAIVYVGLVVMSYATHGARYRPRVDFNNPLRSIERLLLWLGVKTVATILQGLEAALNVLAEASADVGEWFVERRSQKAQAQFRSHVL
jgi:hypothetical protein